MKYQVSLRNGNKIDDRSNDPCIWQIPAFSTLYRKARTSNDTLHHMKYSFTSPIYTTHLTGCKISFRIFTYGVNLSVEPTSQSAVNSTLATLLSHKHGLLTANWKLLSSTRKTRTINGPSLSFSLPSRTNMKAPTLTTTHSLDYYQKTSLPTQNS